MCQKLPCLKRNLIQKAISVHSSPTQQYKNFINSTVMMCVEMQFTGCSVIEVVLTEVPVRRHLAV